MANRIQLRRGGAQEWANENPTLAQGEIGIELDTNRFKIGDGVRGWNTLPYERPIESVANTANTLVTRDADGNFSAGAITATLIGNSATSSRLANPRQIQLSQDLSGSGTFDGSANLSLNAQLQVLSSLPHYDGTTTSTGTYTKVIVDAKGRITNASQPSSYVDLGLNDVQPLDSDLSAIANLTSTGIITRNAGGSALTRSVQGSSGRISVVNGNAVAGNPTIDLIDTTVALEAEFIAGSGQYNIPSLTSVGGDNLPEAANRTVNSTRYTVDQYGRFTSALTIPIATAREGSKYPNYDAATAYSRYAIIQNASKVYQALTSINAGAGAPTHSSGDTGGWRYLAAEATEQKGLASFAQEDFDVDSNGHVTIAAAGVDNTQLQNNLLRFADGNATEDFELDNELTSTTGYRGFNKLNYVKVNDTSGNLLVGLNNTGDGGAGELDVNVRSYFSDPDVTFDGAVQQAINKTGDGDFQILHQQNTASPRTFAIGAQNAGGTSQVAISAENVVSIDASDAAGKVHIEDLRVQDNYLASTGQLNLDPGDDRTNAGLVRIFGDLQIDGTTTTVNSTTMTVDDVTILLGGDTAPSSDDNLDRGIEFRYYDTQARLGFYGWDTGYTDLGGHEGGYRFLHAATNSGEVFSGTDSGIIAGNLKLTTNTNSTSNTTGDLVVLGGVGIGDDVNIGGSVDIDTNFRTHGTSRFDDNVVLQGASKVLQLNNGSGTTKIEFQSTTGNGSLAGILDVTGNFNVNSNKFNVVAASGNTSIAGTLAVTQGTTMSAGLDVNSTLNVSSTVYFEDTNEPTWAKNGSTGLWEIQSNDYGAFRFDGGGYVAGDFMFDSDVVINGTILQRDDSTETFNEQNFLRVRRKLQVGNIQALTPSYASHNSSNLKVFGGAGIGTDLHIGDDLYIGKLNNNDTVKFQVLGESGNTTIQGTLLVENNTNLNGTLDVDADFAVRNGTTDKFFVDNVTGNTDIQGTLDVNGATEITNTLDVSNAVTFDQTLTVQGNSEFNGTVDVDANFAVRSGSTDKMTVASSTGNIATDGTLVVQGQTTINDSLIVQASNEFFKVQNGSSVDKFTIDTDNGNTSIVGTLTVTNSTDLNNTLNVAGITTFENNTDQNITNVSYGADGAVRIDGGVGIDKKLAVGGATRFYGTAEFSSDLDINAAADISGNLTISNGNQVTSFADTTVALKVTGGARINKNLMTGGDFTVYDNSGGLNSFLVEVATGDATLRNDLVVGGNLTVNGTTTTVNSTTVTLDDPIMTLGGDTAPVSDDNKDRGIEFRYYDTQARLGFIGFDNNLEKFRFLVNATNSSEVFSGTDGSLQAGSLNLTGSGTALDVDNDANIDGTLTVDGVITSTKTSGAPFVVNSTSKVTNLNADLLDGMTTAAINTVSTVVNRDSSGNFAAGTITAALVGNSSTATALETARNIAVAGVVSGTVSFDGTSDVSITTSFVDSDVAALAAMSGTGMVTRTAGNTYAQRTLTKSGAGITITNGDGVSGNPTINIQSASTNSASNLVLRDASGNFSAGTITANLTGNVTGDVTGTVSDISNHDTDDLSEGSTNVYYTNARADARVNLQTGANLSLANKTTTELAEGTNQYYTEARVQAKLDNAYEQLRAMLTNLATSTTLTLNLSGDPTPGAVVAIGAIQNNGIGGFSNSTGLATSGGSGTSLTVDLTTSAGAITGLAINTPGTNYTTSDTITITNPNAGGVNAFNFGSLSAGTNYVSTNNVATTGGSGTGLRVNFTAGSGNVTNVTVAAAGTGYANGETVTIVNNGAASATIDVPGTGYSVDSLVATTGGTGSGLTVSIDTVDAGTGAITGLSIVGGGHGYTASDVITVSGGNGDATFVIGSVHAGNATIDISQVFTNATFALSDVTEMEVGATVTGATSGTTGVITALSATAVTVDNVDGFFKKGEVVSANDVTTLTIQSFS